MGWLALATDFDGTIATDGVVDETTIRALQKARAGGLTTLLVTGRELKDFSHAPDVLGLFDSVVVENGAVLYAPLTQEMRLIAAPLPAGFSEELLRKGVPLSVGQVIVATREPYEATVLEVIKETALELQVIFNKGAVMVLPSGVNKATGLLAALADYNITLSEVVGVGDAENDHVFLEQCGLSVAVANAVPALKERVNCVTRSNAGAGVAEFIEELLAGRFDAEKRRESYERAHD